MTDLFTYTTYLSLLLIVIALTYKPALIPFTNIVTLKIPKLTAYHFLALIIIAIVVGFRHNVGVDWEGYTVIFDDIKDDIESYDTEMAYHYINKLVSNLGGNYQIMFSLVAFLSWYFVFKSVPNFLLPLTFFFIFTDEVFFWSMNGVRQFAALSIFIYAIQFIYTKKLIHYSLLILLAMQFHTSAGMLFPLYFLPYVKLYNQKNWLIIFLITSFLSNIPLLANLLESIFSNLAEHITFLSTYLRFFDSGQYSADKTNNGFGFFFKLIINLFIIIYSKKVINSYPHSITYFILFFIGTIIFNLFYQYQPIARINVYFITLRCIALAYIVFYLWQKGNNYKLLASTIISLYFIIFLSAIYNSSNLCCPYDFRL